MPRTLSLHEITGLLETDDSIEASAVLIRPPENATAPVSDEDSGDEEGGKLIICQVLCYAHLYILQRHSLDNNILYSITFSSVLHFLISSVQWDIRQQVQ